MQIEPVPTTHICSMRPDALATQSFRRSLPLHKHCETVLCTENRWPFSVQWGSLWNSTPPPLLCTARGGKTNRSTCIKRSSQGCETGDVQASCRNSLETFGIQDLRPLWTLSFARFSISTEGIFFSVCLHNNSNSEENHAGTVSASLLGSVSDAVWISWRRLRGNSPDELQRHQKLARCLWCQKSGRCQSESADFTLRQRGPQITRRHLAGN